MSLKEDSKTEFKESWRDDYLKTICAFANTNGGKVYVGINDQGKAVGVTKSKKLMEDIPNKIASKLGLFASVEIEDQDGKEIIVITVGKYKVPVSYNGKFYVRSGSTTQELNNKELQKFLLLKSGLSWDDLEQEDGTLNDLDPGTIDKFRSLASEKFPAIAAEKDDEILLEKLRLLNNGKPKKAAILLFGKDPQHFFISAHFKVGKFTSNHQVISHDLIEGNLFEQLDRVMDLLRTKYLHAIISYEGVYRKETLEYPESALREAVINALIHKDYLGPNIQMKIYDNEISLWNSGKLPEEITINELKKKHASYPRNELLANAFYRAGLIESWGQGTVDIVAAFKKVGLPEPIYAEKFGGLELTFLKNIYTEEYLSKLGLNDRQIKAAIYVKEKGKITNAEYQKLCDVSKRTATRDLSDMIDKKLMTNVGGETKSAMYQLSEIIIGS